MLGSPVDYQAFLSRAYAVWVRVVAAPYAPCLWYAALRRHHRACELSSL